MPSALSPSRNYLLIALLMGACDPQLGSESPADDADLLDTGTGDTGQIDPVDPVDPIAPPELPGPYTPADSSGYGRGLAWVRTHPMMVSGLVTMMGPPSAADVDRYYGDFGANTLHLWSSGLAEELDGWLQLRPDQPWISWVLDDGSGWNGQLIGGITPSSGRIGYQVGDEPADMAAMLALQPGLDAVRAADPDALVFLNQGPALEEDAEEMLEVSLTTMGVDIASHDIYTMNYGQYDRLEINRRVALANGVPYWRYLSSYRGLGDDEVLTETDMRWNTMVGLVYGYTGHSWFLYQIAPGHDVVSTLFEETGSWTGITPHFQIASELNRELHNLGRAIPLLTSTDVRFIPSVNWNTPDQTTDWSPGAGGDAWITSIEAVNTEPLEFTDIVVGFFDDDYGEGYVMVQNANHESASWPLYLGQDVDFQVVFDFAGAPSNLDRRIVWSLDPQSGDLVALPLHPLEADRYTLDVTLAGGGVVLFKYATGAPFALMPR